MKNTEKGGAHGARLLGVGLDNDDGHVRITTGRNFALVSGSEATHERMQEVCIKFNEQLDRRGRELADLSRDEVIDLLHKSA